MRLPPATATDLLERIERVNPRDGSTARDLIGGHSGSLDHEDEVVRQQAAQSIATIALASAFGFDEEPVSCPDNGLRLRAGELECDDA